ncbi:hypothetical protein OnM2_095047, partial [Erysiphe neolycopersici]
MGHLERALAPVIKRFAHGDAPLNNESRHAGLSESIYATGQGHFAKQNISYNTKDKMDLDSRNYALPNHAAWRQLAEGWDTIITNSTSRRFALLMNLPRAIQKYLSRTHSVGKSSLGDSEPIDYSDLYPPEARDLQSRLIDEAVCLGQGLGLEANAPTKSQVPISDTPTNLPRAPQLNDPVKFDGT